MTKYFHLSRTERVIIRLGFRDSYELSHRGILDCNDLYYTAPATFERIMKSMELAVKEEVIKLPENDIELFIAAL